MPGPEAPRPDLSGGRRVHVVAAGGSGMSAIATVLAGLGHQVTGSDAADGPYLRHLMATGLDVRVGHHPDLARRAEVVVRSTAVPDSDPEVEAARQAGLPVWRRADVLAAICRLRRTVAVSGTHGKTTTSAMAAAAMRAAGLHPSVILGGEVVGWGPGAVWDPEGEWLVVEADESDGTFVELGAEVAVVTSVEPDHLEFYGGFEGLEAAFERFVAEAQGPVVLCADEPGAARLARARPAGRGPVWFYGSSAGADFEVGEVELSRTRASFQVSHRGRTDRVDLAVPGRHNVLNATAALAAATAAGAEWDSARAGLAGFRGVARRFEWKGQAAGVDFVDGYDHLPAEVVAAIATARAGGWSRVVAVFQPHRYSRTEALAPQFASAFDGADEVVVTGIYPAGEAPRPGVSGRLIVDAVAARRGSGSSGSEPPRLHYAEDLDQAEVLLARLLRSGDVCLTLGAGDISALAGRLMRRLGPG
jgi:UDP-N-acetylmuramate--alanine ligase